MSKKLEAFYTLPARIKIASVLRKAIFLGDFRKGEELSLTEIAAQLNVSRTPVREAFQMLESENLLELRMNKGAIVKDINENFFKDYYEVRILLETKAIEKSIENGIDVKYLEEIHKNFKEKINFASEEEYREYNQNFHFYIWKNANNEKLFSLILNLWNGAFFEMIGKGDYIKKSIEEHENIIKAIQKKDIVKAKYFVESHLMTSLENILKEKSKESK